MKGSGKGILVLVILVLSAVLIGMIAWVLLRDTGCGDGICETVPVTTAVEVMATEASTQPVTTAPPATEPPTTEPPTTQPEPETMRVVTAVSVLAQPQEDGEVLQTLSIGQQVCVTDRQEDWCCLELDGITGYVPTWSLRDPEHHLIVIDPGHQGKGNREKEPIGPGATEKKAKVASGTQGVATGIPEYELTLEVSLLLQTLLEEQGCEVVMLRTHHDVNISNAERAQMANEVYADAFVRIHANGGSNPETEGIMTICQNKNNPYNADLHPYSYALSELVLEEMLAATGAHRQYIWETNTMSGINWCRVPVTIVEMGYMSNPQEDRLMATEEYRRQLAQGITKGILQYLEQYC